METVQQVFEGVLPVITSQINVSLVIGVLAGIVGACVGLVFMYFGSRLLIHAVMNGAFSGKVSIDNSNYVGESDWMNGMSREEFRRYQEMQDIFS